MNSIHTCKHVMEQYNYKGYSNKIGRCSFYLVSLLMMVTQLAHYTCMTDSFVFDRKVQFFQFSCLHRSTYNDCYTCMHIPMMMIQLLSD